MAILGAIFASRLPHCPCHRQYRWRTGRRACPRRLPKRAEAACRVFFRRTVDIPVRPVIAGPGGQGLQESLHALARQGQEGRGCKNYLLVRSSVRHHLACSSHSLVPLHASRACGVSIEHACRACGVSVERASRACGVSVERARRACSTSVECARAQAVCPSSVCLSSVVLVCCTELP
jgi:hypothetical protein